MSEGGRTFLGLGLCMIKMVKFVRINILVYVANIMFFFYRTK